jgi:iron complex outermembrane receptor protein
MVVSLASSVIRSLSGSSIAVLGRGLTLRSLTALATMGVGLMIGTAAHAQQAPPAPAPAPAPQEPAPAPAEPAAPPEGEKPAAPPEGEKPAAPPEGEKPAAPPAEPAPPPEAEQPAAPPAPPADDTQLHAVEVQAERVTEVDLAKADQQEIAGGTSVVSSSDVDKGRKATVADVLQRQPGVYVEQVGGSDAVKISIRGSGINNGPGFFRQGIIFLFDGLSLTGPGGTSYEMLNGQALNYVEVLNGGNAFAYGALGIGGAINFHTQNGLTTPGLNARVEGGSYGYQRQTVSYGGKHKGFDYYLNLSNYRNTGYQDYSVSKSAGAVLNLGYKFSDKLSTRFIGRYTEEWHQFSGPITTTQLADNPRQFGGVLKTGAGSERPGAVWVGNVTTLRIDDKSQIKAGVAYYHYSHINARNGATPGWWNWKDLNASVQYSRDESWWGHQAKSFIAYNQTQHLKTAEVRTYLQPVWTDKGGPEVEWRRFSYSWNRVVSAGLDFAVTPKLWASGGLGLAFIRRNLVIEKDRYPIDGNRREDFNHTKLAPRVGLRYLLTPQAQAFANYTRSYDPEQDWNYFTTNQQTVGDALVTNRYIKQQVPQESDTFEVGVKGRAGIFDGSLALYRANIRKELLTVQLLSAGWDGNAGTPAFATSFNSPTPTVHQGIELGLATRLWEGKKGNGLVLNQSYTFNDFHYRDDPTYGDNALPGQPKHIYNGELQLQLAGFYVGPNVRAVSRIPVDYANTLYNDTYALLGAKAGYVSPNETWSVYVDGRNLINTTHASAVAIVAKADPDPTKQDYFYPGDGRGVYVGVSARAF